MQDGHDLILGGDPHLQLPVQPQFELVHTSQRFRVSRGDDQPPVSSFQRDELVAKHQLQRHGAEQFRLDAEVFQFHIFAVVLAGQRLGFRRAVLSGQCLIRHPNPLTHLPHQR